MQDEGGFSGRHHQLPHIHRNSLLHPNSHFMYLRFNAHKLQSLTHSFIINKYSLPLKLYSPTLHFLRKFTANFSPDFNWPEPQCTYLLMNETVPFQTRCSILWTFFCTRHERFSVSCARSCWNTWELSVKPFHTNGVLLWDIASLWGKMPPSLYFCAYVGCEENASFAVNVLWQCTKFCVTQ